MFRRSQHQNISLRGLPEKDRLALRDSLQAPVGPAAPACPGDAANLVDMTALAYGEKFEGMYPSVGACDEFIRLFLFRRVMCHSRNRGWILHVVAMALDQPQLEP